MGSSSKRSRREEDSDDDDVEGSGPDNEMGSESESEMGSEPDSEMGNDSESEMGSEPDNEDDGNGALPNQVDNDDEMEELEKEYSNLRNQEKDLLKSLTRHKDEDLLKGQAVTNQKVLWDKTLEFRCLLQKPFSASNKLSQEPQRSLFRRSHKEVDEAYSELITSCENTLKCLMELQEAIIEKNASITQATNGTSKEFPKRVDALASLDGENDEAWLQIHKVHTRLVPFRNSSVDKWQRKTQVTTGAAAFKTKLHAFNQNISEQVATYMRDPSRMIKRMQLRRSAVGVVGEVPGTSGGIVEEGVNVDGDPELLDDSEFYQQLLKEFLESCQLTSSETTFYAMKKLQPKKRKVVDRRASKSRKIRYNTHEKIVNFMAPERMVLPPMAPNLFESLFGLRKKLRNAVLLN